MSDTVNKAIVKYQVAINKNISEGEILWSRYNAILVFNTILITAIGLSYQNDISLPPLIKIFLPIAGLLSCLVWFSSTLRGFQWIDQWAISARKIEETYLLKEKNKVSDIDPISKGNEHRSRIVGWPNTKLGAYALIVMIGILYVVFLFYAICKEVSIKTFYCNYQRIINFTHIYKL